jgi:ABC-type glycerol-3-phosphate transport system substrate-binding protein
MLSACTVYENLAALFKEPTVAVLWTDRPEFALYAGYFNASQSEFKIEAEYLELPAQKLTNTEKYPDIVAGSWLKSTSTRSLFKPLDDLFKDNLISQPAFYSRLLDLGNIEGKQYLLPVAFNIPALALAQTQNRALSNPFTIDMAEIKELGKAYNIQRNGTFTRMGFSPAWNNEFLFLTAILFNTSFREASPVAWDTSALERAIAFVQEWIDEANNGIQAEDEFTFKYFYDPPTKLALSGRILFTYMNSAEFFTLTEERRSGLDFRWISEQDTIPLIEGTVYYGIYKGSKAKKATLAFTQWFFQEKTQRLLLETARNSRINETHFGIAGGFSAMRTVTEQVFPQFYPGLLGHMPPADFLSPPNILPRNWTPLKEKVILPYLYERIRHKSKDEIRSLERRISEWNRLNNPYQ